MYDKTRIVRPNARGPRLPTMHPLTIFYTESYAREDFRKNWCERHKQGDEPEWSARLVHVRFEIDGCLGILREVQRNKAWWEKPKRTAREKAIFDAVCDLGRYVALTGVRYNGALVPQSLDEDAFRAVVRKEPEAIAAKRAFEAMVRGLAHEQ